MDIVDLSVDVVDVVDVAELVSKQQNTVINWNNLFFKKRKLDDLKKTAAGSSVLKVIEPTPPESLVVVKQKRGPKPKAKPKCNYFIYFIVPLFISFCFCRP